MIAGTSVSSGSTSYACPPEITSTWLKHDAIILGKKGSGERLKDIVEHYANLRYALSHTPNLPERILSQELRDRFYWSALAIKKNTGGASLDREWFKNPTERGSSPSNEDFNDKAEGGGETDCDEEKDRQGSNCKPTTNREQIGANSA